MTSIPFIFMNCKGGALFIYFKGPVVQTTWTNEGEGGCSEDHNTY